MPNEDDRIISKEPTLAKLLYARPRLMQMKEGDVRERGIEFVGEVGGRLRDPKFLASVTASGVAQGTAIAVSRAVRGALEEPVKSRLEKRWK